MFLCQVLHVDPQGLEIFLDDRVFGSLVGLVTFFACPNSSAPCALKLTERDSSLLPHVGRGWFSVDVTTQKIKTFLAQHDIPEGGFVIHPCIHARNRLMLSVKIKNSSSTESLLDTDSPIGHYLIFCQDDLYHFEGDSPRFPTLVDMVSYYSTQKTNELPCRLKDLTSVGRARNIDGFDVYATALPLPFRPKGASASFESASTSSLSPATRRARLGGYQSADARSTASGSSDDKMSLGSPDSPSAQTCSPMAMAMDITSSGSSSKTSTVQSAQRLVTFMTVNHPHATKVSPSTNKIKAQHSTNHHAPPLVPPPALQMFRQKRPTRPPVLRQQNVNPLTSHRTQSFQEIDWKRNVPLQRPGLFRSATASSALPQPVPINIPRFVPCYLSAFGFLTFFVACTMVVVPHAGCAWACQNKRLL